MQSRFIIIDQRRCKYYVSDHQVDPWPHVRQWCFVPRNLPLQSSAQGRNDYLPNTVQAQYGGIVIIIALCFKSGIISG